jgi:hypothetical protein
LIPYLVRFDLFGARMIIRDPLGFIISSDKSLNLRQHQSGRPCTSNDHILNIIAPTHGMDSALCLEQAL